MGRDPSFDGARFVRGVFYGCLIGLALWALIIWAIVKIV